MDMEAKLLALEAAVMALAQTHSNKPAALEMYTEIWTDMVSRQNTSVPPNTKLAQETRKECNMLGYYFKHSEYL